MTIRRLQEGLIDWFKLTPTEPKSWTAISTLCTKLFHQYYPNHKPALGKYKIFTPLLRLGILEFQGQGFYRLSPSCYIQHKHHLVGINAPSDDPALSNPTISQNPFSTTILHNNMDNQQWIQAQNIPIIAFNLLSSLSNITSINNWINGWLDDIIINENLLQPFDPRHSWGNQGATIHPGLYRNGKEAYSPKLLKLTTTDWKRVPSHLQNPDAFNVAVTWSTIQHHHPIDLTYQIRENRLTVRSIYFPIILERLLILNHLFQTASFEDIFRRKYTLYPDQFNALNRLYNNAIPVI